MTEIRLQRLNKVFDGAVRALRDVDLTIADGELTVLVGPSGSGKSTMLRLIAGLESPTSGEIFFGDERMNAAPPRDRDVAMVFQDGALYPHRTARGNMAFGLMMRKTPKTEIAARVDEAAILLSIESLLDRRPAALSGGERQRVAIGRAIVRRPRVFLLDEALSNLDARLQLQLRAEIAAIQRRLHATMLYVTHDQTEAMALGQRIVVMHDGAIQQVGAPREIYERPANRFVAGFIGSGPMNFFDGVVSNGVFAIGDCRVDVPGAPNGVAVLGVRPEDVCIATDGPLLGTCVVESVEHLGREMSVRIEQNSGLHAARMNANALVKPGDSVALHLRPNSWRLFAPGELGERLF